MNALTRALVLSSIVLAPACVNEWVERDPARNEDPNRPYVPIDERGRDRPSDATIEAFGRMSEKTLAEKGRAFSIGCLPYVNLDKRPGGPWVSELGVRLADFVASEMEQKEQRAKVLNTRDLEVRAAKAGVGRATLSSLGEIARSGARLGCDVLVFGTIRRDENVRQLDRDVLTIRASAYSLLEGRIVGEAEYTITNRDPGTEWEWGFVDRDSAWQPDSGFKTLEPKGRLVDELQVLAGVLAQQAAAGLELGNGGVRVEPLDCSTYVEALAHLSAFEAAVAALGPSATAGGAPGAPDTGKVEVLGNEFPTRAAAEAHLVALRAGLAASPAVRFGEGWSASLGAALKPLLQGRAIEVARFADGPPDEAGMAAFPTIVQPKLESLGDAYAIRLEVRNASGEFLDSVLQPVSARYAADLAGLIGERELRRIGSQREAGGGRTGMWTDVYDKAVRAVVQVRSDKGWGSGFLVDKAGLVVTNSHVVEGIAPSDNPHLVFQDGSRSDYEVLRKDRFWDVAVLRAAKVPADVGVLRLASTQAARVGASVAVLGSPKGTGGWVMTPGYLSSVSESAGPQGKDTTRYMYTCPTRGGSSGSPVLLETGEVLAVHSAGHVGSLEGSNRPTELTGFALGVPGPRVSAMLEEIR